MKHFIMLALIAVLSACATATPQEKVTATPVKKTAQAQKKPAQITTAAYMTQQENELKKIMSDTPFKIVRHKNILMITFAGKNIFAPNSYHPETTAVEVLKKMAPVLAKFDKTRISIIGYTDNAGKPATNQLISEKRADAVASILEQSAKIADVRLWIEGRGATEPSVAAKTEEEDRTKNNRVDIVLTPTFVK